MSYARKDGHKQLFNQNQCLDSQRLMVGCRNYKNKRQLQIITRNGSGFFLISIQWTKLNRCEHLELYIARGK